MRDFFFSEKKRGKKKGRVKERREKKRSREKKDSFFPIKLR
jgi:hypothetical protein